MKRNSYLYLAAFIGCFAIAYGDDFVYGNDAIVEITVNGNRIGTGFFISDNGLIATAYHVIQNANSIRIAGTINRKSTDVQIVAFSGNYDIAILQISGKELERFKPIAYVKLSEDIPHQKELYVRGFPIDSYYGAQALVIEPSPKDSKTINDQKGHSLFNSTISAILFSTSIMQHGLSGAPLLRSSSDNTAFGVVSGSIGTGGTISWAIPCKYLKETLNTKTKGLPSLPQNIVKWPNLTLYAHSWSNPCMSFSSDSIQAEFDNYRSIVTSASSNLRSKAFSLLLKCGQLRGALKPLADQTVDGPKILQSFSEFGIAAEEFRLSAIDMRLAALDARKVILLFRRKQCFHLDEAYQIDTAATSRTETVHLFKICDELKTIDNKYPNIIENISAIGITEDIENDLAKKAAKLQSISASDGPLEYRSALENIIAPLESVAENHIYGKIAQYCNKINQYVSEVSIAFSVDKDNNN